MKPSRRRPSIGWGCATVVAFVVGLSSACIGSGFLCSSDPDCGADGTCEASGYCSFPDGECPSGQRYGEHAGTGLAGTCVPLPASDSTGPIPEPDSTSTSTSTSTSGPPLDGDGTTTSGTTEPSESTGSEATDTTDTGRAESTGTPIERVSEGLLVLYPLDEGGGSVAHDQSGVGMPMDLTIEGPTFEWVSDGISIENDILHSAGPATKVIEGCQLTDEITAEAWLTPNASLMEGPARIITLSLDQGLRNFTLGHGTNLKPTDLLVARMRTSDETGDNNGLPQLVARSAAAPALTHLVYVRSAEGWDRLYVDGQSAAEGIRTGDFSTWDETYELSCGNEVSLNRPWQGTLHLVAIYDRALSPEEIDQNFAAGF